MHNKNIYSKPVEQVGGDTIALPKSKVAADKIPDRNIKGDIQLPVEDSGLSAQPASAVGNIPAATANSYTANNETAWANGYESYDKYVDSIKGDIDPNATTALTDLEYAALMKQYGISPGSVIDGNKTAMSGTSEADEYLLSDDGYALIRALKAEYANLQKLAQEAEAAGRYEEAAQYRAQMKQDNINANRVRAGAGYYGGTDGSMYVTHGELGVAGESNYAVGNSGVPDSVGGTGVSYEDTPDGRMKALLDAWQEMAQKQSQTQIDYAVQQAVTELERALQDAQLPFKEQAESVALDERQAMDNAALYAELRGDKGGIGREQYSSIQNAAAYNRLAVQRAQTQLATDTARQIENLRMQGEFDKADAALEITQNYLSQLLALEQWAAEYNFDVAQFNAALEQWEAEYRLAMEKLYQSAV